MTVGFVAFHRPSEEDALNGKLAPARNKLEVFHKGHSLGIAWKYI